MHSQHPNLIPCTRTLSNTLSDPHNSSKSLSLVQRITTTIVFQILLISRFLLPYLGFLFAYLCCWEQEHKLAQKAVKGVGRWSGQILRFLLTAWWLQSVMGGIHLGIMEGVGLMAVREMGGDGDGSVEMEGFNDKGKFHRG
ncbi:hypothetical protein M011DRAFT_312289 [Sporormia fimetaria CBS 119925]|uniref:Uncharacterized protein n=1 Tax=Sporormia fimetaria CBS 119925 TaxID=1340428 RepID=A0A6A6VG35_9PLEO|nr:hypothetical protein M011DRAFT_312289 [Sporormia fimetaria CBS 119925]